MICASHYHVKNASGHGTDAGATKRSNFVLNVLGKANVEYPMTDSALVDNDMGEGSKK
jgi:hypothetical protein